ncbi:Armadillo repeat-containing protein 3 [Heterocephalus glaber]|uniref:Armadillo repeat-containing protein 3 n=1 Tax=Heterocephalus glaber TaxID=10181 RepID=G5BCP6_HETGA|nr:Armadillo repeat-containing protein 3 [Heterocephalus glaber]
MDKKIKKEVEPPPKDVFDPLTIESKKAATVVLMLNSPEEEILAKACEDIYKFALKEEEVVIYEFARLCLANMSMQYTGKVHIFEHGGLEPLIRLLSSPNPDVKKNSIEYIYNLVQDFQCRTILQELNAIPPVLDLLKSEYPVIQLLALKTLGVITNDKKSQAMLRDNQGLDHLIKILDAKELNDLHIEALSVVANCLEDMDSILLIWQTGGLKKLLPFEENSTIPDIQKNAAKAIAKSAYDLESRKLFHKQEVEKVPSDAIEPLINMLSSKSDGAMTNVATILMNKAMQEPLCTAMQSQDVLQALIGPLGSANTMWQSKAPLAITTTTCNMEDCIELINRDGLEPLVELLHSKNEEVRRHASYAVMVCSSDELTATELCRVGALDILEEISLSNVGGKIPKDKLPDFSWELHISKLKFQLKSNVIPVVYIKKGIFYHRALLFKALGDKIGVGCSVVRGEHGCMWNEVKVLDQSWKEVTRAFSAPETCIIDLMFHPGALMKLGSRKANLY